MVAIKAVKLRREVEMFQWVEHKSERYDWQNSVVTDASDTAHLDVF